MTTLTIRKHEKAELQAMIDGDIAAYKLTVQGRNPVTGDYEATGAIVQRLFETKGLQNKPLHEVGELLANGYKFDDRLQAQFIKDAYGAFSMNVCLVKPESEQQPDIEVIMAKATARYAADIEAHNDEVFLQQAELLKAEEALVADQLRVEDEAREAAAFEKRVRDRMRGSRAGAK